MSPDSIAPSTGLTWPNWLRDTFERSFWTFLVAVVPVIIGTDMSGVHKAATAGVAAVFSLLMNSVWPNVTFRSLWADLAVRCGRSSIQAALAVLVAAGDGWTALSVWRGAAVAAGAAALSMVKGVAADKLRAGTISPASTARPG